MSAEFLFLLIQHVFIFIFDRAVGYLASRRSKRDQKKSFLWDRGQHVWRNWLSTRGHTRISFLGQWVSVLGRWSFGFSLFILPNPHKTLGKSSLINLWSMSTRRKKSVINNMALIRILSTSKACRPSSNQSWCQFLWRTVCRLLLLLWN